MNKVSISSSHKHFKTYVKKKSVDELRICQHFRVNISTTKPLWCKIGLQLKPTQKTLLLNLAQ